jgi:hypothetical protein
MVDKKATADRKATAGQAGFNVFIGEPIEPTDKDRLLFTARYLNKSPLSNERLKIIEAPGKEPYIEYATFKDGTDPNEPENETTTRREFI